jgi:outer membrane protein assembly factor BamB
VLFVGGWNGTVYALDAATGEQQWRFETETPIDRAPAVKPAGDSPFEGPGVFFGDHRRFYTKSRRISRGLTPRQFTRWRSSPG